MRRGRRKYVPYCIVGGVIEDFMRDMTYFAEHIREDVWNVVSWENGKLVCDRVVFDKGEPVHRTLEAIYK